MALMEWLLLGHWQSKQGNQGARQQEGTIACRKEGPTTEGRKENKGRLKKADSSSLYIKSE